jgi:hypothetical protein
MDRGPKSFYLDLSYGNPLFFGGFGPRLANTPWDN